MSKKYMNLNPYALAITLAIFWGVYLFILGLLVTAGIRDWPWFSGSALEMIATIYPGYTATLFGSFVGLFWGLLCGAVCGLLIAWLYNWCLSFNLN